MPWGVQRGISVDSAATQARAEAAGLAFDSNFNGFGFAKLGMSTWGSANPYVDAETAGGGVLANGNTQIDVLSYKVVPAPTTSAWFAQFCAKFPALTAVPQDGSVGLGAGPGGIGNSFLLLRQWFATDATHLILSASKAGVVVNLSTTFLADPDWHTFAVGRRTDGSGAVIVDGNEVLAQSAAQIGANWPTLAMFMGATCNTFMQPTISWFALSYVEA